MPAVIVILPEGFEELETVAPVDVLRRAGVEVTLASLENTLFVTGRNGIALKPDTTLAALGAFTADLLLLPGGPGVKHLRAHPAVRQALLRHAGAERWIAAICAAPLVLHDAGLLTGRRYTAHPSVADDLPSRLPDERVVVDGLIVTSRGAGTALEFGLKLVELLQGPEKSAEIASAIAC